MNKDEKRTYAREYARERVRRGQRIVFNKQPLCLCGNVSTVIRGIKYKYFIRTLKIRDAFIAQAYTQCKSCYILDRGRIIKRGWDTRKKKQQENFREKAGKLQELLTKDKYASIRALVREDRDTTEGGEGSVA